MNSELPEMNRSYDLIVVGSGVAGLAAALRAAPHRRVLLVTKGALEESNTRYAQGGIAAALSADDSSELHLRDTVAAGDGLCDAQRVAILTQDASSWINELLARGVPFDREAGELASTLEAAHSRPRVLHAGGDATGERIEAALAAALRESGVEIWENTFCTALRVQDDRVTGIDVERGEELVAVNAPHVVLATGGAGQLFARTTNPSVATGDGLALAWRAGAQLTDLEFYQFHPTALTIDGAPSFLISEAVRGEGGIVRDDSGVAFMRTYHPDAELAPRDVVARAIHTQMERTGGPVWLDVRQLDGLRFEQRFPSIVAFCREWGIDPHTQLIPVSPAAHYLMGGVRTDDCGRSSIHGLWACGEVASTGVHGANRLASNSLLEGLVFAGRVVDALLAGDASWPQLSVPRNMTMLNVRDGALRAGGRRDLAEIMWRDVSVVRTADSLARAWAAVRSLYRATGWEPESVSEWQDANLGVLAQLVILAALQREESRGAHFRADRPERNPAWLGHLILAQAGIGFLPLECGAGVPVHG